MRQRTIHKLSTNKTVRRTKTTIVYHSPCSLLELLATPFSKSLCRWGFTTRKPCSGSRAPTSSTHEGDPYIFLPRVTKKRSLQNYALDKTIYNGDCDLDYSDCVVNDDISDTESVEEAVELVVDNSPGEEHYCESEDITDYRDGYDFFYRASEERTGEDRASEEQAMSEKIVWNSLRKASKFSLHDGSTLRYAF